MHAVAGCALLPATGCKNCSAILGNSGRPIIVSRSLSYAWGPSGLHNSRNPSEKVGGLRPPPFLSCWDSRREEAAGFENNSTRGQGCPQRPSAFVGWCQNVAKRQIVIAQMGRAEPGPGPINCIFSGTGSGRGQAPLAPGRADVVRRPSRAGHSP